MIRMGPARARRMVVAAGQWGLAFLVVVTGVGLFLAPRLWQLFLLPATGVAVTAVGIAAALAKLASSRAPSPHDAYLSLLAQFPEQEQGKGVDAVPGEPMHQPMTYGLVLAAESIRFRTSPTKEGRRRIRNAVAFLQENADLDGDGRPGWGLPCPWHAIGDQAELPANHPYTITTAIAVQGILDALSLDRFWSDEERIGILRLCADVARRWCDEMWSEDERGGFFWYSPAPSNAYFVVNAVSFFTGALARLMGQHPQVFSEEEQVLLRDRVNKAAKAVIGQVAWRAGSPFWRYRALPPKPEHMVNDLLHQAYILWGMEVYRSYCGDNPLPWSTGEALKSLACFCRGGLIHRWPQDQRWRHRERAILWDVGMFLALHAAFSDHPVVMEHLKSVLGEYGPLPRLRYRPNSSSREPFIPRHAAHVLWAIAVAAFQPDPQSARMEPGQTEI